MKMDMFASSEMKETLEKWMEPDTLPAFEFNLEVYQLQILMDQRLHSRMQEQLVLQRNQNEVKESQCFPQSTNPECNAEPVSKGCLPSTTFALPLDSDNSPRLELDVGPHVQEFLPSTSCAATGNSQNKGTPLDKNLGIIISLASPPRSPSPPPPPPSPPTPPPRSPSPLPPLFSTHSPSTSPQPGIPPRSPPHSPRSEPSPTPPPSPEPFTPSPSPQPPPTAAIFPTPPDSPDIPVFPPLPPGSPPPSPPLPDSPYPYHDPPWM